MPKNSFYLCFGGDHFELEGQINNHFYGKTLDINFSTLNHADIRNRAIICNKYIEQMWFKWSFLFCLFEGGWHQR